MIYCYLLIESFRNGRCYRGYTVDLVRRLRQHRGIIKGGARYTKRWRGSVHLMAYVTGFESKNQAMSYEWYTKRRCDFSKPCHVCKLNPLSRNLRNRRHTSRLRHFVNISKLNKFTELNLNVNSVLSNQI